MFTLFTINIMYNLLLLILTRAPSVCVLTVGEFVHRNICHGLISHSKNMVFFLVA